MKSAIFSFFITLGLVLAVSFPLRRHLRNSTAPGGSPENPARIRPADDSYARTPDQPAASPVSGSEKPPDPDPADPAQPEKIAALTAMVREYASKRNTAENITPWWTAICGLAELDPVLAIRLLRGTPRGFVSAHSQSGNADSIVAWWAAKDPDAALAWYWQDPDTGGFSPPPGEIVDTLAARDLPRAVSFLKQWFARRWRGGAGSVTHNGLKAMEVFGAQPVFKALEPHLRTPGDLELLLPEADAGTGTGGWSADLMPGYWQSLAETAGRVLPPAEARAFFEKHPFPPDWPENFLHPAVKLMDSALKEKQDPGEWADWILASVGTAVQPRTQAAVHLVTAWSGQDPEAAGHWLRAFAESDPASAPLAMRTYAGAVLEEDPAAAMQWAAAIPGETARRLAMLQLFPKWAEQDAAAARAWLDTSNWPPEIKRLAGGALKAGPQGS
ncbi:MAG: hypothetical protein V4726_24115 [Verrucomicrobiota bacterium]